MNREPDRIFPLDTPISNGPTLLYRHADGQMVFAVDRTPVKDPRERAICRALLLHALALLDETEVALPAVFAEPVEERP